jgi:hypothetical protein
MNHTRLPKEVLLPDWAGRNMQITKGRSWMMPCCKQQKLDTPDNLFFGQIIILKGKFREKRKIVPPLVLSHRALSNLFIVSYPFCRFQWPRYLISRSAAARLLRLWVRIPPVGHGCLSVVSVVCCQVEVSATSWSLVQRSPTDCGASLCVI